MPGDPSAPHRGDGGDPEPPRGWDEPDDPTHPGDDAELGEGGVSLSRPRTGSKETGPFHARYADDTPVYKYQRPPRLGAAKPVPEAEGPHTQLRFDEYNNRIYQGREFDSEGNPVRDIDFTNPAYPSGNARPGHPGPPHQHRWIPNDPDNPHAGHRRSKDPEPLQP